MTISQLVQCWINGNLTTVIDHVLGLDNPAQIAYYAGSIILEFESQATDAAAGDSHAFLVMLTNRM